MTRMTEKELAALETAKQNPYQFSNLTTRQLEGVMREAEVLRAKAVSAMITSAASWVGRQLGLAGRSEAAKKQKLYRETVKELSKLDTRELADIGIGVGEVQAAARKAVGLPESAEPGPMTRLRQRLSEMGVRRRTARELATLDRRMLADIGIEPGDIEAYLRGEMSAEVTKRQPQPLNAPAVAADIMFQPRAANRNQMTWTGTPEAANTVEEPARAA